MNGKNGVIKGKEMNALGLQQQIISGKFEQIVTTLYWRVIVQACIWPLEKRTV